MIYTIAQAAEKLSVSDHALREWLRAGIIKGSKIGGGRLWRITDEQLDDYLKKCETEGKH